MFGFYGLPDPEQSLQQLARHSQLAIRSEADAEWATLLFYKMSRDIDADRVVHTSRQLLREVEDYYYFWLPEPKARSLASKWWRRFKKHPISVPVPLGVRATRSECGQEYAVSVTYVEATKNKSILLAALRVKVSATGHCEVISRDIIFGGH